MVIDFDLSTILLATLLYVPVAWYLWHIKKIAAVRLLFITIFYAYLVKVAAETLFPIFLDSDIRQSLGQNVWRNMNFWPLINLSANDIKTSILNTALFLPFGATLPLLKDYYVGQVIFRGMALSLGIEIAQVAIALLVGFTFRHFDVNDLIFNTVGTILGYFAYLVFAKLFQSVIRNTKIERNVILDYLDERTKSRPISSK